MDTDLLINSEGAHIAQIIKYGDLNAKNHPADIANAHLIAAAPELYAYGYNLAMLVLQSDFYQNPPVKEAVDNLLTTYLKAQGK